MPALRGVPRKSARIVLAAALAWPGVAHAGMPVFRVSDVASMRVEAISFFLVIVLALTWLVRRAWNVLRRDVTSLPPLTYRGALAGVVLWGLFMQLVLTMIAGQRELMTPGAWERSGATYKLQKATLATPAETVLLARHQQLERLRTALWKHAQDHGGAFPPHDFVTDIPEDTWRIVDPSGVRFVYVRGLRPDAGDRPLAYEPGVYGTQRMALLQDGTITTLDIVEIRRRVVPPKNPVTP